MGDLVHLEPKIYEILSAPGTDLSTISAKRVRRQLLELDSSLSAEWIKDNREDIDTLISSVFEQVSAEQGANDKEEEAHSADESHSSRKRQHEEDDEDNAEEAASPPAKKAKKAAKNSQKLSDEELARKLQNEINGRTTRTSANGKARATKAKGKPRKSAAAVDSEGDSDDDGKRRKKTKSPRGGTGGGAKGGFAKEFTLSEPLSVVLQAERMARPQVVKQLWMYIKDNNLQNPKNGREILCDSNLKAVFRCDKINMFTMNKVLGQHLHETDS
ncbi:SWIB-domain-containing protein [Coprinopsis marcescibilis]|uniref:SWIB-domain-containing protein n=1 Tax=Coprinopsis marcescibilis TaxID=230819 RepID=A0A5C3LDK3_COPMA|nr:SWIB-domain-containing protein [Coprinopsis marcescibilis]